MSIVYTIPQSHVVIIERFGRFSRVQGDGLVFRMPFLESIKHLPEWKGNAVKKNFLVELSEQQTDTPPRQCQTLDNVTITADASIYWKIVDPVRAVYEVDILPKSVSDLALNALRANIGKLKLDQVVSERQELNKRIAAQLSNIGAKWGVVFTRVEIQEINYSHETAEAMMQEMAAERKRRALLAESEGKAGAELKLAEAFAKSTLIKAEALAGALKIKAEAERQYLEKISERVGSPMAGQIILSQKYLEGMDVITKNAGNKVFLPTHFNGMFNISAENNEIK
ncbi:hypothetical protein C900_00414 [Fulvivirga imtechensis AK7]|uniref:Band 7 domain-containing protein n=1 Tax=Fulvivirga imtechensis AK7 TaxID=1237149 RepID=L8JLW8_9BACT|nr:SPFH domain-containing protein [Fulvivirga imtechensis]ELR68382.1 hypothetical protein C900_00414 [Fulvivirga imtechensis AK7]